MTDAEPAVREGWGPEIERRGGRRRAWRVARRALVVVLVLAVALPLAAWWRIPKEPVEGLAGAGTPLHVLVVGSDSREGLTEQEQRDLSTGRADEIGGERTDTIFVLSIDGSDAALLSFPRDLWVERCDGSVGRINVAQSLQGPACLVDTVRRVSGIDVSHYARVTFGGFRDLVDAVGGVELCLDEAIADVDAGIDLPAGCQRLDGADALGFVRVRKIDDDLHRIQRQQQFLRALAAEVASPATLLNPWRWWALSRDAGGAVTVDDGLGPLRTLRLARGLGGLAGGDVPAHTVPTTPRTTSGGAAVLELSQPDAEALFAAFRDGSILVGTADAAIERSEVAVAVLNGAGVQGLAAEVAARLRALGYPEGSVGNAERRDGTLVRHPPALAAEARRLAEDLGLDVGVEEVADAEGLVLLLGSDAA